MIFLTPTWQIYLLPKILAGKYLKFINHLHFPKLINSNIIGKLIKRTIQVIVIQEKDISNMLGNIIHLFHLTVLEKLDYVKI